MPLRRSCFSDITEIGDSWTIKYPSKGISQVKEPSYFCSRFLSYVIRMNFELVFTLCGAGRLPRIFFVLLQANKAYD